MSGESRAVSPRRVFVYEAPDPARADPARLAAYRSAYALMEQHDPAAGGAFARLVTQDRNDALARFQLARLEHGEMGARIVLTRK